MLDAIGALEKSGQGSLEGLTRAASDAGSARRESLDAPYR